MVPRHGFVESRLVHDIAEYQMVLAETLAEDPLGELILMPMLTAKWSGVLTHAGFTLGPANDGATSGRGAKTIPTFVSSSVFEDFCGYRAMELAEIHYPDTGYIEIVEHQGEPRAVQLRGGPQVPRSINYIPTRTTVEYVITIDPSWSLLEWEERCKSIQAGGVVYHPGGSLTTHFSVHCMLHKIPVIIDHEPLPNEVLIPSGWEPPELTRSDYEIMAQMVKERLSKPYGRMSMCRQKDICETSAATLHCSPQWGNDWHLLKLRVEGACAMATFTAVACLGEMRHWYVSGPGRASRSRSGDDPQIGFGKIAFSGRGESVDREAVFTDALDFTSSELEKLMDHAQSDFAHGSWKGNFGGYNWSEIAKFSHNLFRRLTRFSDTPSWGTWQRVMEDYNSLLNAAHNSGKVLDKWVTLDRIAQVQGPSFVNSFVASVVLPTHVAFEAGEIMGMYGYDKTSSPSFEEREEEEEEEESEPEKWFPREEEEESSDEPAQEAA
jgi:hypothetical protein